jgi:hypothetical protein
MQNIVNLGDQRLFDGLSEFQYVAYRERRGAPGGPINEGGAFADESCYLGLGHPTVFFEQMDDFLGDPCADFHVVYFFAAFHYWFLTAGWILPPTAQLSVKTTYRLSPPARIWLFFLPGF